MANTCVVDARRPACARNGRKRIQRIESANYTRRMSQRKRLRIARSKTAGIGIVSRFTPIRMPPGEFIEGEMQAHGFMQGIALCQQYWLPVFDHAQGQQWLRPLSLLGVDATEHHPIGEPVQQIDTTAKERHMSGSASLALAARARNGKR
ncbi:hypothetical protein [Paraburkholderia kirstenboschensis]|uniref:Uncharacterized protein n=1 Tax=Paraburkholderia kirstenboschensis TaxID=1245436 RepID=A0ABZ0EPJ5_9BURK|nr:hypothetical protein [Paraburkholderia kirstenboschensis]WOD18605.1 hypothetical protein RW095_38480 [Paraburkholderia kirstenboschensis]